MTMRVGTKFTAISLGSACIGLALIAAVSWPMLNKHAYEQVVGQARLMLDAGSAVRTYTATHVNRYLLGTQMNVEEFISPSVPSFSAKRTFEVLQRSYPEYSYREAALNPTSPEDLAKDWEADVIHSMRSSPDIIEVVGTRETPAGTSLYVARALRIEDKNCLICHDTPERAPKHLIETYGSENGFGWKLGETVGAQIASVPMTVPLTQARQAFISFVGTSTAVFVGLALVAAVLLRRLVLRELMKMADTADKLSRGDWSTPELEEAGNDELSALGAAFNRLRRSLSVAMRRIERTGTAR